MWKYLLSRISPRLHEWKAVLGPPWKWAVLVVFTILGGYQTIQQQAFPTWPIQIPFPPWAWFLIALVVFVAILEGAYRQIWSLRKQYGIELPDKLDIEVGEVNISQNGIVIADIALRPTKKMQLYKITLECDGKMTKGTIQNEKLPHYIESGVNYKVEFQFFENVNLAGAWYIGEQMRLAHGQGRSEAKLRITADAKPWLSSIFFMPTIIDEPQFILGYSISKMGELTLEKQQRGYRMALTFSILFKNRDKRKPISIDNWVRIGFDTFLSDGSREPYQMQGTTGGTINLKPGEEKEINYEIETWNFDVEPVLGDSVSCHWDEMGAVHMSGYGQRPLKLLEPFNVKVRKIT